VRRGLRDGGSGGASGGESLNLPGSSVLQHDGAPVQDYAVSNSADDLPRMLMFPSVLCYFPQVSLTMVKSVTVI